MESFTLYGTRAWWRMKQHDEQNDPSKPAQPGDAAASRDADEAAPRAPFAPPVTNPSVLSILNGLNPSVTPVPMDIATTDGEMAASYAGAPRRAPIAEETPAPQASVVVRASTPPGQRKKKASSPDRVDTTFRIRPRQGSLGVQIAVGVVVGGILVAVWLGRIVVHPPPPPTAPVMAVRLVAAPAPPPAPVPAPEPEATTPEPTPVVTAVAPPSASVRSVPPSPSSAHPSKDPRRSDVYRAPF
jgi:hypothetical protein